MPKLDWTRVLIAQLAVLAGIVFLIVASTIIHALTHTLLLLSIAAMLAFASVPLVTPAEARGVRRVLAVALVDLGLALRLIASTSLPARRFAVQAALLLETLPTLVTGLQDVVGSMGNWFSRFGLGSYLRGQIHMALLLTVILES